MSDHQALAIIVSGVVTLSGPVGLQALGLGVALFVLLGGRVFERIETHAGRQ